jgi:hypothetical protein
MNEIKKISELQSGTVKDSLQIPVVDGSVTKQVSWSSFRQSIESNIVTITDDYVITDSLQDGTIILCNHSSSTKMMTITLPTLADNLGKTFTIINLANGITKIDGEGAETIDGLAQQYLFNNADNITVLGFSNDWKVLKLKQEIYTNYINWSNWPASELGTVNINVDGGSSPSLGFELGEIVSDTSATGRIIRIVDNADGTGTITVIQCTNGGTFTNNNVLTGQNSGANADVDGNTKNSNCNFYHGLGINFENYIVDFYHSNDGTNANANKIPVQYTSGPSGIMAEGNDTNSFLYKIGVSGFRLIEGDLIDIEDHFYNIVLRRFI